MKNKIFSYDFAGASLTGFASNVIGSDFVLAANSTPDGFAHKVTVRNDSANDHSGITLTLAGTDADGKALTESIAGPGASASVASVGYFATLEGITPSASIGADSFDIGWSDEAVTKTIPLDYLSDNMATVALYVSGTINISAQETFSDLQGTVDASQKAQWSDAQGMVGLTASAVGSLSLAATGIRVVINSHAAGELVMTVAQAGRR